MEWMIENHRPDAAALVWTREAFDKFREAKNKELAVAAAQPTAPRSSCVREEYRSSLSSE